MSPSSDFIVPTFSKEDEMPRYIRTNDLTEEDLEALKKEDFFAYYSIPSVKEAEVHNQAVDVSVLSASSKDNQAQTVERRSRISFECHPDVFLDIQETTSSESDADEEDESDEDLCLYYLLLINQLANSLKRKAEYIEKEP